MKTAKLAISILAVFLSCGQAEAGTVRMASLHNDLHQLALWVAREKGFFQEEGVSVESTGVFRAGPEIMNAFAAGSIDMAYCGEAPATIAFSRGSNVRLAAQANNEGSAIVASSKGDIRSIADLKGKLIAIPGNGSVQDLLVRKAVQSAGLNPRDFDIRVMPVSEMSIALERGDIAAFAAWQPFVAQAVAGGSGKILATSSGIWAGHPCCCLLFSEKMKGSEDMKAVLRAHARATAFINAHPGEAASIAARATGIPLEVIRSAMNTVVYTDKPARAAEEEYIRFLASSGFISLKTDPKALAEDFIPGAD